MLYCFIAIINIQKNISLAKYTTFKIGGEAKFFVVVKTYQEFVEAFDYASQNGIKYFVLGGGANVLFADAGFDGIVIKNEMNNINFKSQISNRKSTEDEIFAEAESGVNMNLLVNKCVEKGYGGLEYFGGHPGTVGGSIFINAHTKNEKGEVLLLGDKVFGAKIYNVKHKEAEDVEREYFDFKYDYSRLKESGDILLSVVFKLTKENIEVLNHRYKWIVNYRKTTQDYGGFTAGCVFQNVQGSSAGKMIEECGLKGVQFGGAKVSERHANFIVNLGAAKASDIIHLINLCKKKVKEKFGVELEEEITII